MYTRGRKKAEAAPAPPARDHRDVETIERLQHRIQELELKQRKPRYRDHHYHPRRNDRAVDHDDRYRDDPIRSMEQKIEIPEFTGKVHPDDFIDWFSMVERAFDVRDIPDKLKVKLVTIKLRQHASLWWDHVTKRRRIEGKSKVETWEKMKKLMKAKFLPENQRQEAFLDYHNLSQRNMTVEEVINEFDKLRMRCDVVEEEEQVVARFLGVFKPEITDIYSRLGHYARDCSNLKTLAFVPDDADPIYDTDVAPEADEPGDELVYPDRGKALVIQRVLNVAVSKSVDDNSWNLGMKIEGHPEPYQLTWLKKGTLLKSVNVVLCSFLLRRLKRLQQRIQELRVPTVNKQQDNHPPPIERGESESNVWDDGPEDVNPFDGKNLGIVIVRYHQRRKDVTVERVFDVRDIPDKLKVKLVAIKLRQHASLWWDHVTKRRRIDGKSKVETWEKMKKLMKAKFLPENHRQEAFLDYHNLSQQNITVEEVINEFDKLRMRCDVVEEEEQVVAWFLGVLKPEIA
ncbi:reverse transcriptase domain-containing protein [Tanacetum coccineum]|uniref:Reverse transcriptase domain-containing protein n=1 Tax=Tanacetum coccineum TaxID=301880 RepID=A0ABQ5HR62_9ASTR